MKKYIKLGLFVLSLAPINHIQSMHEPVHEAYRTNESMARPTHSEWVHNGQEERLRTREDVKAPGSDIEWGKHIFSGDQKMANLGKKISTTAQRVNDWLSDWWNDSKVGWKHFSLRNSRRIIVDQNLKKYSDSNEPNKQLDKETQEAFKKLRPDVQLRYINKFVKTEREKLKTSPEVIENQSLIAKQNKNNAEFRKLFNTIYPDKNVEELIRTNTLTKLIQELTQSRHSKTADQIKLENLFMENKRNYEKIEQNEKEIKENYFNKLDKFRQNIDTMLSGVHLEYNTTTHSFEFHNPKSRSQFFDRSEQTNPTDFSGKPKDKIDEEQRQKNLDEALKVKEQEAAQEKARQENLRNKAIQLEQERQNIQEKTTQEAKDHLNNLMQEFKTGIISRQTAIQEAKDVIEKAKEQEPSLFGPADDSPLQRDTSSFSSPYKQDQDLALVRTRTTNTSDIPDLDTILAQFEKQVALSTKQQSKPETIARQNDGNENTTFTNTRPPSAAPTPEQAPQTPKTKVDTKEEIFQRLTEKINNLSFEIRLDNEDALQRINKELNNQNITIEKLNALETEVNNLKSN